MFYDQHEFDIRCEWGSMGVSQLLAVSDAIVIQFSLDTGLVQW